MVGLDVTARSLFFGWNPQIPSVCLERMFSTDCVSVLFRNFTLHQFFLGVKVSLAWTPHTRKLAEGSYQEAEIVNSVLNVTSIKSRSVGLLYSCSEALCNQDLLVSLMTTLVKSPSGEQSAHLLWFIYSRNTFILLPTTHNHTCHQKKAAGEEHQGPGTQMNLQKTVDTAFHLMKSACIACQTNAYNGIIKSVFYVEMWIDHTNNSLQYCFLL